MLDITALESDVDTAVSDVDEDNNTENVYFHPTILADESGCRVRIDEQKTDATLDPCWRMASQNKGRMFADNGVLYHRDKVCGHEVQQLCVPHGRRMQVMRLSHDAHLGNQKIYCHRHRLVNHANIEHGQNKQIQSL